MKEESSRVVGCLLRTNDKHYDKNNNRIIMSNDDENVPLFNGTKSSRSKQLGAVVWVLLLVVSSLGAALVGFYYYSAATTTTTSWSSSHVHNDSTTDINNDRTSTAVCSDEQTIAHPVLCQMLQRAQDDLPALVQDMHAHAAAHGLLVGHENWDTKQPNAFTVVQQQRRRRLGDKNSKQQLPVVFAHGMGDSCFNSGMQRITQHVSDLLGGVYATCIATGKSQAEDTKNGYFLNMDASVDVFAAAVAADAKLQDGFHAIGFSQGNNVIRGYIARYNSPAVHTFISINGVNAGEGAVPYCRPSSTRTVQKDGLLAFDMCDYLMEQASRSAYTEFAQLHSFQANYWRDARPSAFAQYQRYSQLAKWNNEAGFINTTLVENWSKTAAFVWIMAEEDGMVWPKEGEHWG